MITVDLLDTIQLTTLFDMKISDFYRDSSIGTRFIDRMCALLNITDASRVKIVGVFNGSMQIVCTV